MRAHLQRVWQAVVSYWTRLSHHERRRHMVHVAAMIWLGTSFAREWHALGHTDCAFLVATALAEMDAFARRG